KDNWAVCLFNETKKLNNNLNIEEMMIKQKSCLEELLKKHQ
ncbi:15447_t:CDS:1, partial [Racocetra persica]